MSALVFLAPGFEEIEAITVIDILRRAEIETVVAGLTTNPILAARHTRHLADIHLANVDPALEFEIVVLPGGAEGAKHLGRKPTRARLAGASARTRAVGRRHLRRTHRPARPRLAAAGAKDHQPSQRPCAISRRASTERQRVIVDGKLITSLAAGSAMEFAFEIVRQLRGSEAVEQGQPGRPRRGVISMR